MFEAFAESKRRYVERLSHDKIEDPTAVDKMHRRVMEITGRDPLPYGIEPNRPVLDKLIESAVEQGIIARRIAIDDLFARGTHGLRG